MIVVLLSPSGSFAAAIDSLPLDDENDTTILITALKSDFSQDATEILLGQRALGATGRWISILERSVIGRNLLRVLPIDGGYRFAARARRNPEFRTAIARADLVVALERDAVLASWIGLRRWAPSNARGVFGLAPARALLTSGRGAWSRT
ncbi:hypothetical protein [Microbacterium aerolatum]|uniref:Uncharacterized protein n=1 Tax=Microbacterium aerolatum TaxID=153731 RepID=A0A511AA40_9MICO|nr:hypothetical protein [Microbacterium aerolatum]GEK84952.1 hypothetical protein MAE01_01280 [Microbacterium aerolatum]GGB37511.1 hypothetical protein GCM10007198_30090 [Microbacterium aerolatum]